MIVKLFGALSALFLLLTAYTFLRPVPEPSSQPQPPIQPPRIGTMPPLGAADVFEGIDTVEEFEVTLDGTALWIYRPVGLPAPYPAVLIAPQSEFELIGAPLHEYDRDEHLLFAEAGFVVVAYDRGDGDDPVAFFKMNAGLDNARRALAFAQSLAFVDQNLIFAAGHGTAGETTALLAAHAPTLSGFIMFNSTGRGCWEAVPQFKLMRLLGGVTDRFCARTRARSHLDNVRAPAMIFGSTDDEFVEAEQLSELRALAEANDIDVHYDVGAYGSHYDSMFEHGIPSAISWIKKRAEQQPHADPPR